VLFTQVVDDVSVRSVVRPVRGLGPRHFQRAAAAEAVLWRDRLARDLQEAGALVLHVSHRRSTARGRRGRRDSYVRSVLPRIRAPDPGALRPKSGAARPSPRPILAAFSPRNDYGPVAQATRADLDRRRALLYYLFLLAMICLAIAARIACIACSSVFQKKPRPGLGHPEYVQPPIWL
jgi:hypothetical protein